MDNSDRLLDLTIYGRPEQWEDSPPGWPKSRKGTHPFRSDGYGTGSILISRPIAQWRRLKAGYSDDLGGAPGLRKISFRWCGSGGRGVNCHERARREVG